MCLQSLKYLLWVLCDWEMFARCCIGAGRALESVERCPSSLQGDGEWCKGVWGAFAIGGGGAREMWRFQVEAYAPWTWKWLSRWKLRHIWEVKPRCVTWWGSNYPRLSFCLESHGPQCLQRTRDDLKRTNLVGCGRYECVQWAVPLRYPGGFWAGSWKTISLAQKSGKYWPLQMWPKICVVSHYIFYPGFIFAIGFSCKEHPFSI